MGRCTRPFSAVTVTCVWLPTSNFQRTDWQVTCGGLKAALTWSPVFCSGERVTSYLVTAVLDVPGRTFDKKRSQLPQPCALRFG